MNKKNIILGLIVALFLAMALSPFASSFPDGLEEVAEHLGFIEKGEGVDVIHSPVPDYLMPGIKNEALATSFAGGLGTIIVFGAAYGVARVMKGRGR